MPVQVFVTGATGYIGGDALYKLAETHPEYEIVCLVRNSEKGAQVASQFVNARLVYGDIASEQILEEEARKADVVLHCASADDEEALNALIRGLLARSSEQPGYLIQTSGTGILCFGDLERKTFGEASSKIFDDWDGIDEVTSLPESAPHRKADKIVLAAAVNHPSRIRTAIICPPCIYGKGRGPGNQRSMQMPDLTRSILEQKQGFQVGEGLTKWSNVHIHDLSDCYVKLIEAAASGGGKATWGTRGYYFTENGEHIWGQISKLIAQDAQKKGFISSEEILSISAEEADQRRKYGFLLWGANSRSRAIRARKFLEWTPTKVIEDEISELVDLEARSLGLTQGHAAKVAG